MKGEMQCAVDKETEMVRVEYWRFNSVVRKLPKRDKRSYIDGTYMHNNYVM